MMMMMMSMASSLIALAIFLLLQPTWTLDNCCASVPSQVRLLSASNKDASALQDARRLLSLAKGCEGIPSKDRVLNELYYKLGVLSFARGQEWDALSYFNSCIPSTGHYELCQKHLQPMLLKFGLYDQLADKSLVTEMTQHDPYDLEYFLQISPYSAHAIESSNALILEKLSHNVNDIQLAHTILHNYQNLVNKCPISIPDKLDVFYNMSILQMFVLNQDPSHSLQRCLQIDMDHQGCKKLSILNNKWSKVNLPRSQILDPLPYMELETWNYNSEFYFKQKPLIKNTKAKNNYKLVQETINDALNYLFRTSHKQQFTSTEFIKYIDTMVCMSTPSHCAKATKLILGRDQLNNYQNILKGHSQNAQFLHEIWETYPHIAMYMVSNIIDRNKKHKPILNVLHKFFHDCKIMTTTNKYIKSQYSKLVNALQQFTKRQQHRQTIKPASTHKLDYYKILGVPKSANAKDIRKAYLQLTKKYHPDKQGQLTEKEQKQIHDKMSKINDAYEILSDETKKKEYDNELNESQFGNANANPFAFNNNFKFKFGSF